MRTSKKEKGKSIESKEDIDDDVPPGMEPVVNIQEGYSNYRAERERKTYGEALRKEEENKLSMERQKCRDIASKRLQKYGLEIRRRAENKEKKEDEGFDITGVKITALSKSVVKGLTNTSKNPLVPEYTKYVVPDSVAHGYEICERVLANPQTEDPIEALVEFVATMKFAATEGAHGGQKPKSKAYYETFLTKDADGETIFAKSSPVLAAEFDAAVESKLMELKSEKYSESLLQEYLKKFGITSAEQDFIEFQEKMQKDTKNVATINALVSRLKKPENMSESVFNEGQQLLLDTLTRMTLTFSKTDLILYKEDFLKIIETLDPENSRSDVYKAALNQFFDHHISMMTTLTDRYRLLYLDLAVNAIAIAAQPVAGAVAPLLPTQVVDTVKTATFGTTGTGEALGAVTCKATKAAARDLPTLSTANPIIHVPRPESRSEKLLKYTSKDKQKKLALAGATIIAGLTFGPVGAAVVGVGGGTLLYAEKFCDANIELKAIEKTTRKTKDMHEEAFCKFCVNLLEDSPDMDERKITEIDRRLGARRQKVHSTHSSTDSSMDSSMDSSSPSQSTNDIFVQLHKANPKFDPSKLTEFDPSELTEFDPSEVIPRLSQDQDEEFKPTIPKLEAERAATTTVTTESTPTSSEKDTKHNSDEDNTLTPVELHAPKHPI